MVLWLYVNPVGRVVSKPKPSTNISVPFDLGDSHVI